jgi:D-alanyl-D-alanine carboxypeptidase
MNLVRPRWSGLPQRAVSWALLTLALAVPAWAAPAAPYKGYIVMDAATGDVLLADNADEISPPASMTKLMTYAVLADKLHSGDITLQTRLTVTPEDAKVGMLRHATAVWLRTGEVFTVDELIYAMMIQSANDAAYMVGRVVGGDMPHFIAMMNAKAQALGMTHSTFRTPNGFPVKSHKTSEGDLTSPRDFALLCRYLLSTTDILHYTSVKARPFGAQVRFPPTLMANHNHLLGKVEGVDGLKTGFTDGAGFCLATTAQRHGRRIIVVLMDSPDRKTRDMTVIKLIQRGFETTAIKRPRLAPPGPVPAPPASGPPTIKFTMPGAGA